MRNRMRLLGAAIAVSLAAACGGDGADGNGRAAGDGAGDGGTVEVVASFYPWAEAAQRVGGDRVEVTNLTAAGAEPHDLELTPGQVESILDGDLVVVVGRDFQPAVEELARRRDGETIVVLEALDVGEGAVDGHDGAEEEALDPHVWLDPLRMGSIVDAVADSLAEVDPGAADAYERNAASFEVELEALHDEYATGLADCERRTIVTAHSAFGWLAARYDLRQEPIAGISPDQEPSADRLAELADLVEREGITTIFTETLVSPRVTETLAREAGGVRTAVLNPIEGLTADDVEAGHDYLSLMRANLEELRTALGCA